MEQQFPNGFEAWYESFFEVVQFITLHLHEDVPHDEPLRIDAIQAEFGHGGLYELARAWTTEFEELNKGRVWDGDFFDDVEAFCLLKNNEAPKEAQS
jgi:hypothetical protein